ncbi:Phage integrase, N-terminal SAM-like domain [Actinokineospora alba]|uniref:Phage integrase, N-terminal SAM-like domain n=1 Tax=Actinokineospora alba TaxID=504798 RepID=A0A1H0T8B2_9PSEU|nr:site-specific integrase [Actinokineospora alba]TDP66313.1 integrase-like protein [Actinokineospora alba]SDJ21775.1 Phage integrase, N-terminal SAM-like domain [Actinokineospora alba]SDP50303.1 Phage integrase, N-terminal SAM-like domain [Actinokineospora alba]
MVRKKKNTRNPNGRSSIYFGADGYWHGRVTMGVKDDGSTDRRHVKRKEHDDVVQEVQKLERQRDGGVVKKSGAAPTVAEWLTHWVENISAPTVRYRTIQGYRIDVYNHLIPRIGKHRMDKIEPEHFEKVYAALIKAGNKPGMAHHVHRTARIAFGEARRRKVITEQPFDLVKPPRLDEEEVEPFEPEEIQALMAAAMNRRNGVRFILALALGTRKGETLGFKWSRLNKTTKLLRVSKQRQRHTYEHGCINPARCAEPHHKTEPCKETCKRHKNCPPPCRPDCVKHAMHCPQRVGGVMEVDVKSKAGRRGIRLPDALFDLLIAHKEVQDKEREIAADLWHDEDFMFAQPNGKAIDPRTDHNDWKALLAEADVRDARLHDARHTAATVLLLLGVPERAVMDLMGWSNATMAQRYQHVTAALRNDIAAQLNGFLWKPK